MLQAGLSEQLVGRRCFCYGNHDFFIIVLPRLTVKEPGFAPLMLQNATSKTGRGGRRKLPLVFTEYGAVMAANVSLMPSGN